MTTSYRSLTILFVSVLALVGYNFLGAAWTPAPANPPSNNVAAPINVGTDTQVKNGRLNLRSGNDIGVPTSTVMFRTNGNAMGNIFAAGSQMWSPEYCDETGQNCFRAEDVSTSTSGNPLSDCYLAYRFRRNVTENYWEYVKLDGSTNEGAWSTWSAGSLNDECNGAGCGVQMKIDCEYDPENISAKWQVSAWSCFVDWCTGPRTNTSQRTVACVDEYTGRKIADSFCSGTKPATTGQTCTATQTRCGGP